MGVTQQTIAQYEKIRETPKLETVRRIANALDIKLYELIDDWTRFSHEEIIHDFIEKADSEEDLDVAEEVLTSLEEKYKNKYTLEERLLASYEILNKTGKIKAVNYVEDLSKISEYQDAEEIQKSLDQN